MYVLAIMYVSIVETKLKLNALMVHYLEFKISDFLIIVSGAIGIRVVNGHPE